MAAVQSPWGNFWYSVATSAAGFALSAGLAIVLYLWKRRDDEQSKLKDGLMQELYAFASVVISDTDMFTLERVAKDFAFCVNITLRLNYYEYSIKDKEVQRFCLSFAKNIQGYTYSLGNLDPYGLGRLFRDEYMQSFRALANSWPNKLSEYLRRRTRLRRKTRPTIAVIDFEYHDQ